jgi:hypothetical protein
MYEAIFSLHILGLLSRVWGSVTTNNGFWILWLNYSAIAKLPTSEITRTCSILILVLSTTASFGIRFSYNHFARTQRKTSCIVEKACLPRRCLATGSLLLRAWAGRCLPVRYLAMDSLYGNTHYNTVLTSSSHIAFCWPNLCRMSTVFQNECYDLYVSCHDPAFCNS